MRDVIYKSLTILLCLSVLQVSVFAADSFIIRDIRVEGLQRISPGTVFNYLPVQVGDRFDDTLSRDAVRSLFRTGFFDDVRLERDGDILVVVVVERPAIGEINITGNRDIKTDDLLTNLRQVGFAEGRIFDQALLDMVRQELRRQYFSLGKYAVRVDTTVTELDENRVGISIDISEGRTARIKEINIVGNDSFRTRQLLREFNLTTPTWLSFITRSDQYSRQKLSADLESLRSFYLDRGYINFNVESTQVSITPDKQDIYITINVSEGDQFAIGDIRLAGDLILPKEQLVEQVDVYQGDVFSRKAVTQTSTNLSDALGEIGYAFANVNAIPDIDNENKIVDLTFFVDPGKRVYVRRINFSGNKLTRDEVLRREMRQQEGGWFSTTKIERGKVRLQRLGYFRMVDVETPAVPGTTDQVDVEYTVDETQTGNFMAGIGFSQSQGIIFQTSITQDNFLGSGKRVSFAFNNSEINRRFSLSYLNPYYTVDGISRGFSGFYQETDSFEANLAAFDSTIWGGGVRFGIPVTENNYLDTSLDYENTRIRTNRFTSDFIRDELADIGNRFNVVRAGTNFTYDTRNKAILPDAGSLHRIQAQVGLPVLGRSLEFWKIEYRTQWYFQLIQDYILSLRGELGYGDGYGKTSRLPFFENFYAGGPRTVRGFEESTLGPRDDRNRPLGGNKKVVGGAEVILPIPFLRDLESMRISGFMDAGNVYGPNENINLGDLRYSAGLSGIWVSPFGVVSVSIAAPLNKKSGDRTQPFQFTFGTTF